MHDKWSLIMNTFFTRILALLAPLLLGTAPLIFGQSQVDFLPFGVKVGGQDAVYSAKANPVFAKIAKPVSGAAEIEVASADTTLIILNIFPTDEKGGNIGVPKALLMQNTNKSTLDKNMEGKKLEPGWYGMNVVASQKTARVLFKVE